MTEKKRIKDVPVRFQDLFFIVLKHCKILSFIPLYDTMDDGMKYMHDTYFEEDQEDFPVGIAGKRFNEIMRFIQDNFPNQWEQYDALRFFSYELNNFDLETEKRLIESIKQREDRKIDASTEKRQLDIIIKIRKVYQEQYKEQKYILSGQKQKDIEEHEYILRWIEKETTEEDWVRNQLIDHWFFIDQMLINSEFQQEDIEEIEYHQYNLFFEHVKLSVQKLVAKHEHKPEDKKQEIFNRHLKAIRVFFDDGNSSDVAVENLGNIFSSIRFPAVELIRAYNKIINQEFNIRYDLLINITDKLHPSPFLVAHVLYNYRNTIEAYLEPASKKNNRNTNKQSSFQVKEPHKTNWLKELLIQLQFKIELLREPSTPEKLYDLLTAKDYNEIKEPIYVNCETKQFVYVINALQNKFTNLKYSTIERSEKFISAENNLIKADNMSNSKTDYPKEKEEIDAVFNAFMK